MEKIAQYVEIQKSVLTMLQSGDTQGAIAKMEEGSTILEDVLTTQEQKTQDEQLTQDEVQKIKKYVSLYVDSDSLSSLMQEIKDAQATITSLTKNINDMQEKIDKIEKTPMSKNQIDISKTSESKRPSLSR